MSAAAVFQQVLRIVVGQQLPAIAQENIVAALEAGRPGPLEMFYEAGAEALLSAPQITARAAACYFFFCTANLCDDLSDGDATYLGEPYRAGRSLRGNEAPHQRGHRMTQTEAWPRVAVVGAGAGSNPLESALARCGLTRGSDNWGFRV